MTATSQRRVTRDGPKKQMGASNLNRSGRASTEVVVCCEPCALDLRHCVDPWRKAIVGRAGGRTSFPMHPGRCQSLSHHAYHQRHSMAASGLLESCLEQSRRHVYRGAACVAYVYQGVWLSHALVALSRAPSRPWLVQFVQSPSPTRATARCAT